MSIGAAAATAGWLIRWWRYERALDDHATDWLTNPGARSPRGLLFDVFVNGTHPLLPWLAFLCAGIVMGRVLGTHWWRPAVAGAGFVLYAGALVTNSAADSARTLIVLSDDPFERGIVYTASALGTALLAFVAISWIADRYSTTRIVDTLRRAGQMSLTIYLAHALAFNLMVDWLEIIEPRRHRHGDAVHRRVLAGRHQRWPCAYQRRYGRGPAERLYRRLTT